MPVPELSELLHIVPIGIRDELSLLLLRLDSQSLLLLHAREVHLIHKLVALLLVENGLLLLGSQVEHIGLRLEPARIVRLLLGRGEDILLLYGLLLSLLNHLLLTRLRHHNQWLSILLL